MDDIFGYVPDGVESVAASIGELAPPDLVEGVNFTGRDHLPDVPSGAAGVAVCGAGVRPAHRCRRVGVGPLLLRLPAASNVYWQSKVYGRSDVYWQFVGAGPWTPGRVKRRVGVG